MSLFSHATVVEPWNVYRNRSRFSGKGCLFRSFWTLLFLCSVKQEVRSCPDRSRQCRRRLEVMFNHLPFTRNDRICLIHHPFMPRTLLIASSFLRRTSAIVLERCRMLVINRWRRRHPNRILTIHPVTTRMSTCLLIRRRCKSIHRFSNNVSVIRIIIAVNNNNSLPWTNHNNNNNRTIDQPLSNRRIWFIVNSIHPCHSIRTITFKKWWRITSVTSAVLGKPMSRANP